MINQAHICGNVIILTPFRYSNLTLHSVSWNKMHVSYKQRWWISCFWVGRTGSRALSYWQPMFQALFGIKNTIRQKLLWYLKSGFSFKSIPPFFLPRMNFHFQVNVTASSLMSNKFEKEGAACWKRWWKQLHSRLGAYWSCLPDSDWI